MAVARRAARIGALVGLLLVALPGAAAVAATLDAEGALPLRLGGAMDARSDGPAVLVERDAGSVAWTLDAASMRLVEVEYWAEETGRPSESLTRPSGVRTVEHSLSGVEARLVERLPGFTGLVWPDRGAAPYQGSVAAPAPAFDWATEPDARMFRLAAPLVVSAPDPATGAFTGSVLGRAVPFVYTVPGGSLHLQAADAVHVQRGALAGYVTGASWTVRHDGGVLDLLLAETVEERDGSVYLPEQGWTGPGTHQERIRRYVQFEAAPAVSTLATQDAATAVFADRFQVDVRGALSLAEASGSVAFADGSASSMQEDAFEVRGTFVGAVTPAAEPGRARIAGSGDVAYVRTGASEASFSLGPVAMAAVGAATLGAVFVAWKFFGGAVWALFSRVAKDDVLDHELRSGIYDLVRAHPGSSPNDLVAQTGAGWSTVMYHLSVLERNELVVALKDGRYRRYFDRSSGRFANGRKNVVSALKNPTTAAMARRVRDQPGIVQRRLAEEFGLAASSVHWHIRRLEAAGLVVKRRDGQGVALEPGPGWDAIDAELAAGLIEGSGTGSGASSSHAGA